MPAKKRKNIITDEERRKRLREAAREHKTSDDPEAFDRAFKRVVRSPTIKTPASE